MTMPSWAVFLWMQISHDNEFLFEMDGFEARVLYHSHTLHIVLKALDSQKKNFGTHTIAVLEFFKAPESIPASSFK